MPSYFVDKLLFLAKPKNLAFTNPGTSVSGSSPATMIRYIGLTTLLSTVLLIILVYSTDLIEAKPMLASSAATSSIEGVEGSAEFSPLFMERRTLIRTRASDERRGAAWNDILKRGIPKVLPKQDSFSLAFRWVTRDIDKALDEVSRRFATKVEKKPYSLLTLEPATADFVLQEWQEITVTLMLRNASNRQIQVTFPTSQRMEILAKDQSGTVLERWSDDRRFDSLTEIVVVNPNETVAYSQQLPTRRMKSGEIYLIEASLFDHPQYTKTAIIRPR